MMLNDYIIDIFSRQDLIKFLKSNNKLNDVVIISVTDPNRKYISKELLSKADDFLCIKFWDVEDDNKEHPSISEQQAQEIAQFIWKYRKTKKFIVSCEAGYSRSPGIALAIICIIRNFGNKYEFGLQGCPSIDRNSRFFPNWFVFNRIIDEFQLLKEKF